MRLSTVQAGRLLAACLIIQQQAQAQDSCTPCPNKDDSYDPALFQNEVPIPDIGLLNCGLIQNALPSFPLKQGDEDCIAIQALGTYCGCPVPENTCGGLCPGYNKETEIENLFGRDGYTGSCELVNSILESLTEGTADCYDGQALYFEACGCEPPQNQPTGGSDPDPTTPGDDDDDDDDKPVEKEEDNVIQNSYTVCLDGSPPGNPDKDVSHLLTARNGNELVEALVPLLGDNKVTCGIMDNLARQGLVPAEIAYSREHVFFAGVCSCPPIPDACEFCPTHDLTTPNEIFPLAQEVFDIDLTCAELDDALSQIPKTSTLCWTPKNFAHVCGCNGGTAWYLGADTEKEHKVLAWIPRISGFLSFLGSLYIIQDIVRQNRKSSMSNGLSTYQMIMVGMSLFDISSSLAWMVSTLALPEYDEKRQSDSGIYGAKGNEATCKVQGFFLELGFVGSTAFTASLTTFYVFSIIKGYREAKMKPLRKYFMAIPTCLAIVLAAAAIPFYQSFYVACWVSNPNTELDEADASWTELILFSIIPIGVAVLISIVNMAAILRFVIKQNQRANKWRFASVQAPPSSSVHAPPSSAGFSSTLSPSVSQPQQKQKVKRSKTEVAVFWQAFWYVMAFLLTWVIYVIGLFKPYFSSEDEPLYAFWITLLILNPLMGFWNAFVYVKPWTWTVWEKISLCKGKKDSKTKQKSSHFTSTQNLQTSAAGSSRFLPVQSAGNSQLSKTVTNESAATESAIPKNTEPEPEGSTSRDEAVQQVEESLPSEPVAIAESTESAIPNDSVPEPEASTDEKEAQQDTESFPNEPVPELGSTE